VSKQVRNLAIALGLAFAIAFLLKPSHKTERRPPEKESPSDSGAAAGPTVAPNSLDRNRRVAPTRDDEAAQRKAAEADENMLAIKESVRSYRNTFGENPIGSNAEITRALTGGNSRQSRFLDPELKLKDGQVVDRWKHPLFFHQLSRTEMEIRSAGPDGVMWTTDDEVLR